MDNKIHVNKIGLEAIQHKDGWWVGTDKGVTCFADHDLAKIALTIIWQREGGGRLKYRIRKFTGADQKVGEHTPLKSAVQAIEYYEKRALN